ncbi:hypothetical protein YC2023_058243 [Brassica napus]
MQSRKRHEIGLHGNGSGYVEVETYESAEAQFLNKLGSGYVLEAYNPTLNI